MIINRINEVRQNKVNIITQPLTEYDDEDNSDDEKNNDNTLVLIDELKQINNPHDLHKKLQELPNDRIGNNFKMFFTEKLYNMHSTDNLSNSDAIASLEFISAKNNP